NHSGQQFVVLLKRAPSETIRAVLEEVLAQHGLPMGVVPWVVRFEGRRLELDQTLAEALGEVEGRDVIELAVSVEGTELAIAEPSPGPGSLPSGADEDLARGMVERRSTV